MGKDLIAIGVETGKRDNLIELLESRFGPLDSDFAERIKRLTGVEVLAKYYTKALKIKSLDQLFTEE